MASLQGHNCENMSQWIAIGALALVAIAIPLVMMFASWLLRPSVPEKGKRTTYESGEVPTGTTRSRFNIQYYMVALLFLVFDVETVLIFPWAMAYPEAIDKVGTGQALIPMLVFIGILLLGLVWAWRTGAIRWIRSDSQKSVLRRVEQ